MKNFSWRVIIVLAVILSAIIYILPTINQGWWPHKKINLGLDLQGGMHLVLEVDAEKSVESTIERMTYELHSLLKKENIRYIGIDRIENSKISLKISGNNNILSFDKLLDNELKDLRVFSKSTDDEILTIILNLPEKETRHIKKLAVEQALETIRNRIDQFGVNEPDIRLQGERRI
ncbi:MAG: protein translocase subunit SecD, partial [Proteobacteria bacterium]|nr:protein translocase subunit SecD [Pseudomonadota bacterium]